MTVLVLSDIHANLEALEAVLAASPPFDAVWLLGDAVGYGPDPNRVVERLADLEPEVWLAGNHDRAALQRTDLDGFNPNARIAAEWTAAQLDERATSLLRSLEPLAELPWHDVMLVHGSPRRPTWEYIHDAETAMACFTAFDQAVCFFGHTHVPAVYQHEVDGALRLESGVGQPLYRRAKRRLINPGSVGQPRDGDPRASFATYEADNGRVTFHRAHYDIEAVQTKMMAAGLPSRLVARLEYGM